MGTTSPRDVCKTHAHQTIQNICWRRVQMDGNPCANVCTGSGGIAGALSVRNPHSGQSTRWVLLFSGLSGVLCLSLFWTLSSQQRREYRRISKVVHRLTTIMCVFMVKLDIDEGYRIRYCYSTRCIQSPRRLSFFLVPFT